MRGKLLLLLFVLFAELLWASGDKKNSGEKFQITLLVSPSFETMNDRKAPNIFDYKFSYNTGIEYKHFLAPDFSISSGVIFQNKGFRTDPVYINNTGNSRGHILIAARYLTVPLVFDGHIKIAEKFDFIMSAGICGGYLVNESFIGRRIDGDAEVAEGLFSSPSADRQPLDVFNNMYWGLNLGAGFCKYIASKLVIAVEPYYRRQLNSAIDPTSRARGYQEPRFDSFSLDVKIGYYFNKNIRNYRKTF